MWYYMTYFPLKGKIGRSGKGMTRLRRKQVLDTEKHVVRWFNRLIRHLCINTFHLSYHTCSYDDFYGISIFAYKALATIFKLAVEKKARPRKSEESSDIVSGLFQGHTYQISSFYIFFWGHSSNIPNAPVLIINITDKCAKNVIFIS